MSTIQESGQRIALDRIRVPDNVRSLDEAHVQALAGSIALQGVLVPLVVRPDGDAFGLVAGFHRLAAARIRRGWPRCRWWCATRDRGGRSGGGEHRASS